MKTTKKDLKAVGIYNPHNLAERGGGLCVYVDYFPAVEGRAGRYARWVITRVGYQTDPKGHWTDNYNKTFTVSCRAEKEPNRIAAIEWATNRYDITEWERSPFGSYHPKGTLEAIQKP